MFAMQIVNLAKKSNDNTDKCSVRNSVIDDDFIIDTSVSNDGTWGDRTHLTLL